MVNDAQKKLNFQAKRINPGTKLLFENDRCKKACGIPNINSVAMASVHDLIKLKLPCASTPKLLVTKMLLSRAAVVPMICRKMEVAY